MRPIAVGETLRRLVAKCLCSHVKSEAREWLSPLQVGVAVPLGAEAAVHSSRHWVHAHRNNPDKVFLKLDFVNAFNTVDRATVLREVRLRLPAVAPWAEWCYSHHTKLLFQGEALTSEAGVQQGDPLGPLLFALALQPSLCAAGRSQLDLCFAYLDDVCLAGDYTAVSAALGRLVNAARQVGLHLNVGKCELTTLGGPNTNLDSSLFPPGLRINHSGEFVLLGSALGSPSFCHQHTKQRAMQTEPLLQALGQLPDSQTALMLLRHCASWSKLVYSSRVTPPPFHQDALKSYDLAVLQCLESCCTGALTPGACLQATLSTKSGGLGLRSIFRHSGAAYTASVLATSLICSLLLPTYNPSMDAIIANLNESLLAADHVALPPPHSLRQRDWSRAVDRSTAAQLASAFSGPGHEAFRAHLQLLQEPGAGAWLQALPSAALGLHVDSVLFRVMVRLRLRLPLHSEDVPCRFCDGVCDTYGDHSRACPCGGDRTKRHNRLRTIVATWASAAGLHPELEKPGLLPPRLEHGGASEDGVRQGPGRRPADVYVPHWGLHGAAAFDLAVTSGLRVGAVAGSAQDGSRSAADYEARKRSHHNTEATCTAEGLQFVPLVAEACAGGWAPAATSTWKLLARAVAGRTGESVSVLTERLQQTLALTLQRENARAVLRRAGDAISPTVSLESP